MRADGPPCRPPCWPPSRLVARQVHFTRCGDDFDALVNAGGAPGGHVRAFDATIGTEPDADNGHGTHVAGTVGSGPAGAAGTERADDLAGATDDAELLGGPPGGDQQEYMTITFRDVLSPAPGDLSDASADDADGSTIAIGGYVRVKKLNSGG